MPTEIAGQDAIATVNRKFWQKLKLPKPSADQGYSDIEYQLAAGSLWSQPSQIERNIISAVDQLRLAGLLASNPCLAAD